MQLVTMETIRAGPQTDYLLGLDHLRKVLTEIECNLDKQLNEFYQTRETNEIDYEKYLQGCNEKLLASNNELRKTNIPLSVIDSELQIVTLLNGLRSAKADSDIIGFITEFWENIKTTVDGLHGICNKFQTTVLRKLKSYCISYGQDHASLELSAQYANDISGYITELEKSMNDALLLLRSYDSGIKQQLFTNSSFIDKLLLSCDYKAFPILRLTPDVSEKIRNVCNVSRRWIDRDETYVHDVNNRLREMRKRTRLRELDLKNQREQQKQILKNAKLSQTVFQKNKQKLLKIENELKELESQIGKQKTEKKGKSEEKQQKETMIDFLNIGITQTKRNYTLQMKRSKLMKHLKTLEEHLLKIEQDVAKLEKDASSKSQEKEEIVEKVGVSEQTYGSIKKELDSFNINVEKLQQEVSHLTDHLTQLEIIQNFKTSPERVDSFYGRPSSVKLAPSLKEKIRKKRRKIMNKAQIS